MGAAARFLMGAGRFHFGASFTLSHLEPPCLLHDEVDHLEEEEGVGEGPVQRHPGGAVRGVRNPHLPSSASLVSRWAAS